MSDFPCLVRSSSAGGEARYALGDPLVDSYLAFVAGRSRPNTLRAVAHDLKTFFMVVDKAPVEVAAADVFDFVAEQRGDRSVVRISDGESGLSARTIARRLSSVSGFYAYLVARGDTAVASNPVPRGLSTRRRGGRRQQVPLVRVPRTLPKILSPAAVTVLLGALRTDRDRAMVYAMVLGGLRRCEVLGQEVGSEAWHHAKDVLRRIASNPTTGPAENPLDVRLARVYWCWLVEYFKRGRTRPMSIRNESGQNRTPPDNTPSVPNSTGSVPTAT